MRSCAGLAALHDLSGRSGKRAAVLGACALALLGGVGAALAQKPELTK